MSRKTDRLRRSLSKLRSCLRSSESARAEAAKQTEREKQGLLKRIRELESRIDMNEKLRGFKLRMDKLQHLAFRGEKVHALTVHIDSYLINYALMGERDFYDIGSTINYICQDLAYKAADLLRKEIIQDGVFSTRSR